MLTIAHGHHDQRSRRARVQNEPFRVWVAEGRPFVVYKAAVSLDGRVTVPDAIRVLKGE